MEINKINPDHIIWTVFILSLLVAASNAIVNLLSPQQTIPIGVLEISLPFALLVLHAVRVLSFFRTMLFILLSACIGFIFEFVGVEYGTAFGGSYFYNVQDFGLMLFGVPIAVLMFWSVFIYSGYTITSSFLAWLHIDKPKKGGKKLFLLPLLVVLDGVVVVAIDIFMDPLMTYAGKWTWVNGGPYFGIPIENFIGWFFVVILATGIFRIVEYLSPRDKKINNSILFVAPIAYGVLCINFFSYAVSMQHPELALIGTFAMMPIVLVNSILFTNRGKMMAPAKG